MSSQKRHFFPFFSSKSTNEVIKERVAQCNCDFFQVLLVDHKKWPKKVFFPILYLGSNWSTNLLHIVIRILENKPKYGDIVWRTFQLNCTSDLFLQLIYKRGEKNPRKKLVFFSFFSSQSTKKVIKECVAWFNCGFFFPVLLVNQKRCFFQFSIWEVIDQWTCCTL